MNWYQLQSADTYRPSCEEARPAAAVEIIRCDTLARVPESPLNPSRPPAAHGDDVVAVFSNARDRTQHRERALLGAFSLFAAHFDREAPSRRSRAAATADEPTRSRKHDLKQPHTPHNVRRRGD